jgi:hypothetical protein
MDWTKAIGVFLAIGTVFAVLSFVGAPTIAGTAVANQSALQVNSVSISDDTLEDGGSTEITAEVENTGVFSDTFEVRLEVDGSTVQTTNVFISGYSTTEVTFQESFSTPGEYSISVNGVSGGTVTVGEPASFDVTDASLSDSEITPGESVETTASVENTGDLEGTFDAELEIDGQAVESQSVTLGGGESTTVTFDRTFSDAGSYDVSVSGETAGTVTVLEPASFEVTDASLSDSEIVEGDTVETTASVENTGDLEGSYDVELEVDGQTVDSQSVTLDGGESTTVAFDRTFSDAGSYDVSVSGESAGSLEVLTPPDIEATTLETSPNPALEGETVDIQVTLENDGGATGEFDAQLQVDGSTEATKTATVEGKSSTQVSFERSFGEAGEYSVQVSGSETVTVTVEEPASFSVTDLSVSSDEILAGDSVGVTATVANSGDREGTFEADLEIDGQTVSSKSVTVDGDQSKEVSFTRTIEEPGSASIQVADSNTETVTVDRPATFDVTDISLSDSVILEGDSTTVTGTVTNVGDRSGDYDVELIAEGRILQSESVELDPGESATVSFEERFTSPGQYDISLSGTLDGVDLQVDQPATFQIDDATVNRSETLVLSPVGTDVTVSNVGDREGNYTVGLASGGDVVAREELTIGGSSTESVMLTQRFSEAGEYDLRVNGTRAGTVTIEERPEFELRNISIPADLVAPGEQTTVEFVAENPSNLTVTRVINVTAGAQEVGAQTVTLDAGERREMTVDFEGADGNISVEGREAGSVRLLQESQNETTETDDDGEAMSMVPIFLTLVMLVVFGGVGGAYYLKQRRETGRV